MHKKRAIFVKQATIGTVFTVKSAKCHILESTSGSFLKKMNPAYGFGKSKAVCDVDEYDNKKSVQVTKK
jgi:hypothetical protein